MIIKPICPKCGHEVKVNVKKIDKLEAYIKTLESNNKQLRALIDLMDASKSKTYNTDLFSDLFGKR